MSYIKLTGFFILLFASMVSCDPAHAKAEPDTKTKTNTTETERISIVELSALKRAKNKIRKPITPTDKMLVITAPVR